MIQFLTAAGFHCLTIDVRGHGENPAETLPVSAGEFGTDALAAFEALTRQAGGHRRRDLRPLDGWRSGRSSPAPPMTGSPRSSPPPRRPIRTV